MGILAIAWLLLKIGLAILLLCALAVLGYWLILGIYYVLTGILRLLWQVLHASVQSVLLFLDWSVLSSLRWIGASAVQSLRPAKPIAEDASTPQSLPNVWIEK